MASVRFVLRRFALAVGLARGGVGAGAKAGGSWQRPARAGAGLLGLWLVGAGLASAQAAPPLDPHRRIDSLEALVRAHPQPDTVRVQLLTTLVDELMLYDTRSAGRVLPEALRVARQVGHPHSVAEVLLLYADYCIGLTRYGEGLHWLGQAERLFDGLHNRGGQVRCLGRRARVADQQGRYAPALAYALRGMALCSPTGPESRFYVNLQIQAGSVYARIGQHQLARMHLLAALRVARRYDYPDRINLALGELGELARGQRQWPAARRYYAQSRTVSRQINDRPEELRMDLNVAEMSEQLGDTAARAAA